MSSRPVDFLLDRGFDRGEDLSIWLYLKWRQFPFALLATFRRLLWPEFFGGACDAPGHP